MHNSKASVLLLPQILSTLGSQPSSRTMSQSRTLLVEVRPPRRAPQGLAPRKLPNSATGTRARVARVRAEYPNQLDYSGCGGTTCSGPYPHMTLWVSACPSLGEQKCFRCEIAGGRETNAATEHVLAQEDKGHREGDI